MSIKITDLPSEIIFKILKDADPETALSLSSASTFFYQMSLEKEFENLRLCRSLKKRAMHPFKVNLKIDPTALLGISQGYKPVGFNAYYVKNGDIIEATISHHSNATIGTACKITMLEFPKGIKEGNASFFKADHFQILPSKRQEETQLVRTKKRKRSSHHILKIDFRNIEGMAVYNDDIILINETGTLRLFLLMSKVAKDLGTLGGIKECTAFTFSKNKQYLYVTEQGSNKCLIINLKRTKTHLAHHPEKSVSQKIKWIEQLVLSLRQSTVEIADEMTSFRNSVKYIKRKNMLLWTLRNHEKLCEKLTSVLAFPFAIIPAGCVSVYAMYRSQDCHWDSDKKRFTFFEKF